MWNTDLVTRKDVLFSPTEVRQLVVEDNPSPWRHDLRAKSVKRKYPKLTGSHQTDALLETGPCPTMCIRTLTPGEKRFLFKFPLQNHSFVNLLNLNLLLFNQQRFLAVRQNPFKH